jgi:hypothetical protein
MNYRQALTPDALQARTSITIRSLNRAERGTSMEVRRLKHHRIRGGVGAAD